MVTLFQETPDGTGFAIGGLLGFPSARTCDGKEVVGLTVDGKDAAHLVRGWIHDHPQEGPGGYARPNYHGRIIFCQGLAT